MTAFAKKNKPAVALTSIDKTRKKRMATQNKVSKTTASPAKYKNRIEKNLVAVLRPFSFETEMFKSLRGKILHPLSGNPPKSILVTSAVPGEGKSFVAANLAVTIARYIQEYVLLMDCDLRKPCIHTRFGLPNVYGLSEHLTHDTDLAALLLRTMIKKLTILPSGRPPHNPSELLSSSKMNGLLLGLKEGNADRYIIVDAPPPALAPETLAISKNVDGILIVIRHNNTPQTLVTELINSFEKEKVIGAVLNRFDLRSSHSYGYGKYKQYKKYYNHAE